jgi:hypothetical protein
MAKYNTFAVVKSKTGKIKLVTSSARKAANIFEKGKRIEVWNENFKVDIIRWTDKNHGLDKINDYIQTERDFIRKKQERHERRNGWQKEKR